MKQINLTMQSQVRRIHDAAEKIRNLSSRNKLTKRELDKQIGVIEKNLLDLKFLAREHIEKYSPPHSKT